MFGCLLWSLFPAYLITHIAVLLSYVPTLTGIELLLQAASLLLPGIATAHQNLTQRRILWTLWPLWASLTDAVPNITLPGSGSCLGTLLSTVGSLNWRLYRLVIEIRDAGLTLRAYVTRQPSPPPSSSPPPARYPVLTSTQLRRPAGWRLPGRPNLPARHPGRGSATSPPRAGKASARRSSSCSLWPASTPARCPPSSPPTILRRSRDTHPRHRRAPFPGCA